MFSDQNSIFIYCDLHVVKPPL